MLKARRHDGILLHTAVPLKKDDFNTPYGILFSEKENDGFDRFQNRRLAFGYLAMRMDYCH